MTETLFIRLGSQAQDTIHWLIVNETSSDEPEIIASGNLSSALQLNELNSKAEQRQVKVLVPGCDVLLKSLKIPAKSNRAMRLAAPYMLEDSVAEDVEQLFFAYADLANDSDGNNCFSAIVSHSQMQQWLLWLADAEIQTAFMLPDTLTIPYSDKGWSVITLNDDKQEQVIVRQDIWQGFTADSSTWELYAANFSTEQDEREEDNDTLIDVSIQTYSPLAYSENFNLSAMPEELPLALMAKNYSSKLNKFNLLQGQYKLKEVKNQAKQQWLLVAGIGLFALLLNLGQKGVTLWQLNAEQEIVQQNIITQYKESFPKTKKVRITTIKSQLKRELALMGGISDNDDFLALLAKLQPVFAQVPGLKPESLKFDSKRQELRLQAKAKDYQAFEKFSMALAKTDLTVKQGSQSNQDDGVTGSFTITNRANGNKGAS